MLLLKNIAIILLGFSILSCGFKPVYSEKNNETVNSELSSIELPVADERLPQIFNTKLSEILFINENLDKKYRLEYRLINNTYPLAIQLDNTITRYEVQATLEYKLVNKESQKVIIEDKIKRVSGYDRVQSDYATYISEKTATQNAVNALASDLRTKLVLEFVY